MKVIVVKDQAAGGKEAYKLVREAQNNGAKVFGLATGSTPISMYDELVKSDVDFSKSISVNLDEYVGIGHDNDQSYFHFMTEHLFSKKPFAKSYLPNGLATDAEAETKRYDKIIEENPIDLQILGIGQNGHIGFNEPGSPFEGLTSKVALTESTIKANARFFNDIKDVPTFAYSMGIGSIMKAKEVVLMAYGEAKADCIKALVEGPVTEELPASILQQHPNATIIIDEAAARKLNK